MPQICLAAVFGLSVVFAGCGTSRRAPAALVSQPLEIVADWNDLEAAVFAATGHVEMAIVSQELISGRHVFELRTIRDEPAELVFTREDSGKSEQIRIRIWSSVGRFGDSQREAEVLRAVAKRLGDLTGVGTAPIRW